MMDDAHDEVYEDRDKLLNIVEDDIDFCIYEQGVDQFSYCCSW